MDFLGAGVVSGPQVRRPALKHRGLCLVLMAQALYKAVAQWVCSSQTAEKLSRSSQQNATEKPGQHLCD